MFANLELPQSLYDRLQQQAKQRQLDMVALIDQLLSHEPDEQPTPTFGSAKGLVKIEANFDDPIEGFEPYL